MPIDILRIRNCVSDDELFDLLGAELRRRLPDIDGETLDDFVVRLEALPRGFRAMAAIYRLDVSMALEDLAWHFRDCHHRGFAQATVAGLLELECEEMADAFGEAFACAQPYWELLAVHEDFDEFLRWYETSELRVKLDPLDRKIWDWCETRNEFGLMTLWLDYARKYPERLTGEAAVLQ